jgi:hemerythrin-like metal-binding domain
MALIKWEESYSVGIKEIDAQHQKMIGILNEIYSMILASNYSDEDVVKILQELVEYADLHFTTEEKYFLDFNYDQAISHQQIHDDYRRRMDELKICYTDKPCNEILSDLSVFLEGWWVWHINHTDKEYTQCFHDHGLF